jgi:hypothetical protein
MMDAESKADQPVNPETRARHRRETFLQIYLPLIFGGLLAAAACVLPIVVVAQAGEVGRWADISLIWLILPMLVVLLIPLALVGGLGYGVTSLLQSLPAGMFRLLQVLTTVNSQVRSISDRLVEPFVQVQSSSAGIRSLFRKR